MHSAVPLRIFTSGCTVISCFDVSWIGISRATSTARCFQGFTGFIGRLRRPYLHTQMSDPIWKCAADDALTCWLPTYKSRRTTRRTLKRFQLRCRQEARSASGQSTSPRLPSSAGPFLRLLLSRRLRLQFELPQSLLGNDRPHRTNDPQHLLVAHVGYGGC
jgi:hypothetical protein